MVSGSFAANLGGWMGATAVGSFNWLSAHRSGELARHDTSLVYRGQHLWTEIHMLENSLQDRFFSKLL